MQEQRDQLRRSMRAARRALSAPEQHRSARAVLRRIRTAGWMRCAQRIGLYMAGDGELSAGAVLSHAHAQGKACFLPVLPGHPPLLRFARYHSRAFYRAADQSGHRTLAPGRFGIPAPRGSAHPAAHLDLIFVPLVAFARNGARLGRGGGFYDRALAPRAGRPGPLRVGLAHALQEVAVDLLPSEPWDVALDIIVTPDEIIHARSGTL